jgi:hypothetical protein
MTPISAMSRCSEALVFVVAVVSLLAMLILGIWVAQSDAIDVAGMDMNVVYTIQKRGSGSIQSTSIAAPHCSDSEMQRPKAAQCDLPLRPAPALKAVS